MLPEGSTAHAQGRPQFVPGSATFICNTRFLLPPHMTIEMVLPLFQVAMVIVAKVNPHTSEQVSSCKDVGRVIVGDGHARILSDIDRVYRENERYCLFNAPFPDLSIVNK